MGRAKPFFLIMITKPLSGSVDVMNSLYPCGPCAVGEAEKRSCVVIEVGTNSGSTGRGISSGSVEEMSHTDDVGPEH